MMRARAEALRFVVGRVVWGMVGIAMLVLSGASSATGCSATDSFSEVRLGLRITL